MAIFGLKKWLPSYSPRTRTGGGSNVERLLRGHTLGSRENRGGVRGTGEESSGQVMRLQIPSVRVRSQQPGVPHVVALGRLGSARLLVSARFRNRCAYRG